MGASSGSLGLLISPPRPGSCWPQCCLLGRVSRTQSCALPHPISFCAFSYCSLRERGELVAMWLIGFDISSGRGTQPHPHLPVSQPPGGGSWRHWGSDVDRRLFICLRLSGGFSLQGSQSTARLQFQLRSQGRTSQLLCCPSGAR